MILRGYGVRAVWQSGYLGDVGSGQVRVCILQKLLGQLHIASLYLKELVDNSGQHGHHPCKQTSCDFLLRPCIVMPMLCNVLPMLLQDPMSIAK